ncbi:hypothetical protein [Planctopirus hydrillae]|uniref:hypothetical protein n=1 Tax=Planctopirus hydrillae TaxID=1841610 RepID=UPI0010424C50|nr:hypothetical protein [Planctopirus hydrillae]
MTAQDYKRRLDDIDWAHFQTAYGRADDVPAELLRLASSDHCTAMEATHKLWCGLCHQHAYVSSAALPALPFILEVLDSANDELTVEILDILTGFAICSTLGPKGASPNEWERNLRDKLRNELPRFTVLTSHGNEEIAGFAERIVENLNTYVA